MKRQAVLLLCGVMAFSAGACASGADESEISQINIGAPDYSGATGKIVLDSWIGPLMSEEAYKEYADCGYDRVHFQNTSVHVEGGSGEQSFKTLNEQLDTHFTLAEKNGIDVILAMNARNMNATSATPFEWVDRKLHPTLQKWKDSDTFYGYMAYDEPTFALALEAANPDRLQRAYADVADYLLDEYIYFSENYPGKAFETVLLHSPEIGGTMAYQKAGLNTFDEYLDYYYEKVMQYMPYEERIYSMDSYAFGSTGKETYIRDCFFSSLEGMAYKAEERGAEKWCYMMNHAYVDSPAAVLYQYYSSMAYGYTNFVTYCYRQAWGQPNCSIDTNGNKTDAWYYYQAAHKEVRSFENVYMQFTDGWQGAIAYGGTESGAGDKPWRANAKLLNSYPRIASFTSTQDALAGIFKDKNGYEGFMITNQAEPHGNTKNKISVTFRGAQKALIYMNGEAGKIADTKNGTLELTLKSGGGAFVIPFAEA